jgi:hypothetical protein
MKAFNFENILVFLWVSILVSINSYYTGAIKLYNINNDNTIYQLFFAVFNFIRFYLPFILLPVLIFFYIKLRTKKDNIIIVLFLVYWLWQLFCLLISNKKKNYFLSDLDSHSIHGYNESLLNNLHLVFSAISLLLIISVAKNLNFQKFIRKILKVTFFFVGLIAIYFTFNLINESIENNTKFIYWSETLNPNNLTFGQANPRITGVSRIIVIFYFLFFFLSLKNSKKIIFNFILIFLWILIYKMQARGSIVGIIALYLIFFLLYPINFKKKLFTAIILLILPTVAFESYYSYLKKIDVIFMKTENGKEIINKEVQQKGRRIDKISDSSGRLTIWKNILFIIKEKKIGLMGYGPQSDRFLLAQLKNNTSDKSRYVKIGNAYMFDTNASNSFLYAYLCGGIIGIALFISIYFMSIKVILYNIFKKKIFNHKNVLLNFSTITLIYLGLRAFFENSFSVFSLDYVFFIITYFIAYETKISSDKI